MIVLGALIVAAVVAWAASRIVAELRAAREEAARARTAALLELFAPALTAAQRDPRAYLVWQPLATIARQMFPVESAALDRAAGGTFPFTTAQLQAAHAQWTADWLSWERTHDADYKLKAVAATEELAAACGSAAARGKLEAVEREKIDLYQRRYSEYIRVAKALQSLAG